MPAVTAEPVPMIEMNTTPLIDVMLVLLVMLIIHPAAKPRGDARPSDRNH